MAAVTTTNNNNHHHHHSHLHDEKSMHFNNKNSYNDTDDETSEKLQRLRISNNSTPNTNRTRPSSTLNHSHHQHHQLAAALSLTSPSENFTHHDMDKIKINSVTHGRIMTASSPSLLNSSRLNTPNNTNNNTNVNKTPSIRVITTSNGATPITPTTNVNNKKLSALSKNTDKNSQLNSKYTKQREFTFAGTSSDVTSNSLNGMYSQTYTIIEGVADTTNSENFLSNSHDLSTQQQPPSTSQIRYPTKRRVSEADLKYKEEKEKRLQQYDLLSTVGTGTFGRVMVARHQETKEYYALKIMSIVEVVRLKQVDHVKNEKSILELIKHPFVVKLFWTHHSEQYLYMLLEYVPGGELFSVLRQFNKFEPKMAVFYAAEIVCALEYLHSLQIVYRDLKPENILLDIEGHLKLTDFGFAKRVTNKTFTLCGTPEYLAPEIIQAKGHNSTADWWALGVLIYEMLSGTPPFYDESTHKVYEKILQARIEWPRHFEFTAKDIIKRFLASDPSKRLGSGNSSSNSSSSFLPSNSSSTSLSSISSSSTNASSTTASSISSNENQNTQRSRLNAGAEEVKRHRWFVSITNWDDVYNRRLKPPYRPKILHDGDTSNFEKYETPDLQRAQYATIKELDLFYEF